MIEQPQMSMHANARMQQRGIPFRSLELILENADRYEFVGSGCKEQWISRKRLKALRNLNVNQRLIERAAGVAIVVSEDGVVVTVYHKTVRGRRKKNKQHACQRRFH
jgi:hypothetical protein